MRFLLWSIAACAVIFALGGCDRGELVPPHRDNDMPAEDDVGSIPTPSCPSNPDCFGCSAEERCPDYWVCEDLSDGRKQCVNPGPDYPDDSQDWECEDVDGQTVCRGDEYPDDGGGDAWDCERRDEFVECTNNSPAYPDGHGDGPWDCRFEDEFRVCEEPDSEDGDGGGWTCYGTVDGRECRQDEPDFPDDRDWECYDDGGQTICEGRGEVPDGGGGDGWNCEDRGEFVRCTKDSPDYPDGGGGDMWDCTYQDEFRVCRDEEGGGFGDSGDSECIPGQKRWCDDAVYCSWGKQTCRPDGTWGECVEPEITSDGLADRPATDCGCRYFYFNAECCERDDCIIPEDHEPPACESDGSLCSYCDAHGDCAGGDDYCIFHRDGYAFCSRDCSDSSCPDGYECTDISTPSGRIQQCVPVDRECG